MEHVFHTQNVLKNIFHLLKPGGQNRPFQSIIQLSRSWILFLFAMLFPAILRCEPFPD